MDYAGQDFVMLHIPKTGGTARNWSLRDNRHRVWMPGHDVRLSHVYGWDVVVFTYVRYPVTRFVSGWAHYRDTRWPTPEDMAMDDLYAVQKARFPVMMPAMYWLNRPLDRPNLFILGLETMDWTWPRLMGMFGLDARPLPKKSEGGYNKTVVEPPPLSETAKSRVLDAYSDDLAIWHDALVKDD